jgi:hypothetical protein
VPGRGAVQVCTLHMDGANDYLLLPLPDSTLSVTTWVWIEATQPLPVHYLFDARQSTNAAGAALDQPFYLSNLHRGSWVDHNQSIMYDDSRNVTMWSELPTGRWVHLYLSSSLALQGQLILFSRAVGAAATGMDSHSLRGRVGSVAMWGRTLPAHELSQLSLGSNYQFRYQSAALLALFELEECQSYAFQYDVHILRDSLRAETDTTGFALPLPPHGPTWHHDDITAPGWHPFRLSIPVSWTRERRVREWTEKRRGFQLDTLPRARRGSHETKR